MKKEVLQNLIGEEIEDWEIVNVDYEGISQSLYMLLQQFKLHGGSSIIDRKEPTSNIKKFIVYDEFAFSYWIDGKRVNCFEEYFNANNGLKLEHISSILTDPTKLYTTCIHYEWIKILQRIKAFDKEKYKEKFAIEFKKQFLEYYSKHPENKELADIATFFNDVIQSLNNIN